jgi:hypothetical protein
LAASSRATPQEVLNAFTIAFEEMKEEFPYSCDRVQDEIRRQCAQASKTFRATARG